MLYTIFNQYSRGKITKPIAYIPSKSFVRMFVCYCTVQLCTYGCIKIHAQI